MSSMRRGLLSPDTFRKASAFITLLTIFVGAAGIAGWLFHLSFLTELFPGTVRITFNTAICMVLLGLSLWLQREPGVKDSRGRLGQVFAAVVSFIGALSLLEIIAGWDLHIDQLLLVPTSQEAIGQLRPGLMSPITAICFLLLGLGTALLDWMTRRGRWISPALAIAAELASSFALLDFVLSPRAVHLKIALQTAIVLCAFPIGLLASRPQRGLIKLLRDTTQMESLAVQHADGRFRFGLQRYAIAVALVAIAVISGLELKRLGAFPPFLTFYPAVMITCLIAGVGAGLLSVLLSTMCADYFFLPPLYQFGLNSVNDSLALDIFLLTSTGYCVLLGSLDLYRRKAQAEAQRAGAETRTSEMKYRTLVENLTQKIVYKDRNSTYISCNENYARDLSIHSEDIGGKTDFDFYPPEFAEEYRNGDQRVMESGKAEQFEERYLHDGKITWVNTVKTPVRDEKGNVNGVLVIFWDISDRKQAEAAARAERERFEAMLDALPAMICLLTTDYQVAFANRAFRGVFGESNGKRCYEYCFEQNAPCSFCESFQVLKANAPHDWEVEHGDRVIHVFDFPFRDSDGSPLVLEMDIDVTKQRLLEQKLQESLRYNRGLLETSLDPLVTISHHGKVTDVNEATEKVTGIRRDQLVGTDFCDYFTDPDKARQAYETVFAEGAVRDYALSIHSAAGQVTDVLYNASTYCNAKGEIEGVFAAARDVTEQRRIQQRLECSEARYRSLVTATSQIVWTASPSGEVIDDMPTWREFTGLSLEQIRGWGFLDSVHPEDRERLAQTWCTAAPDLKCYEAEYRIRRKDGEYRVFEVRSVPIFEMDGTIREWVGTCTDITERKYAEAALKESEERYRSVVAAMAEGVVLQDADGKIIACNESAERLLGISKDRLQLRTSLELQNITIHEDGSLFPGEMHPAMVALRTGKPESKVCMGIRKPDGATTWILINAQPMFNAGDAKPYSVVTTFADITERKRAEEKVREEQQKFNSILDVLTPYIVLLTEDYHVAFANREFRRRFGESHGKRCFEFLFDRTEPCEICETYEVMGTDQARHWEWTGPDGRNYEVHDFPFTDTDGSRLILEMGIDITERKEAELAREESETRFRVLANFVPQMVWMCHPDGLNFYFNQRWVDYTGMPLEESYGRGWAAPFHPNDKQAAWDAWNDAITTGETYHVEGRIRAANGSYRWFLMRGMPLLDQGGKITRWFGTCTDIDDLKHAESELRKMNEELEHRVQLRTADLLSANKELESFNYTVAHDLRAPLRHVRVFSDLLIAELGPELGEKATHYLSVIQNGVSRMGELIDDLLSLSRIGRHEVRRQVCKLRPLVNQLIGEFQSQFEGRNIEWRIADLPLLDCDTSLFRQVLANLLSNAIKFTRGRNPAVIEIGRTTLNGETVIYVRDNGVGFDMKYSKRLFGLFQRLHREEDFEGTGVGLAIVERIMRRIGGRVWAEAVLNQGATFYISLHSAESRFLLEADTEQTR